MLNMSKNCFNRGRYGHFPEITNFKFVANEKNYSNHTKIKKINQFDMVC